MQSKDNQIFNQLGLNIDQLDQMWHVAGLTDQNQSPERSEVITDTDSRIGKYRLIRLLGTGSFGVVYQAHDEELDRDVALKLPRLEVLLDEEKRKRFAKEAVMAARLDHPGIVSVYEAKLDDSRPYIASALCHGPTMQNWLSSNQDIDWRQIVNLIAQIADSVHYAHQHSIFHRDIKPANILLEPLSNTDAQSTTQEPGWQPKLTDFGLAKFAQLRSTDTRSSIMLGTPAYMAPENLLRKGTQSATRPKALDAAADIYSLGVILFESLTGQLPVAGEDYIELLDSIRENSPIALRRIRPELPRSLEKICCMCLEKNPEARYRSAGELAADLRNVLAGRRVDARPPSRLARLHYWGTQPQRVTDAGWFTVCWQSIAALWLLCALVLPLLMDISFPNWNYYAMLIPGLVVLSSGPVIALGWLTTKKVRWGLYAGLVLTSIKMPFFLRALVAEGLYLEELFQGNELMKLVFHFLFVLCLSLQLILYCCAVLADRKHNVCSNRSLT